MPSIIIENNASGIDVAEQDNFDTLTCVDMGEAFSMSQTSEDDEYHDVIIGRSQAEELLKALQGFLA